MRALVFDGSLALREVAEPVPATGEVLIRTLYAAICNTDLEIIKGYMGFHGIPGHEFVGEVVSPGSPYYGKRVTGEINCSCGTCYLCMTNRKTHCPDRSVLGISGRDGVFADYFVLPEKNLHLVPDELDDEKAIFTEPLAAALEIAEQVAPRPSESVFIFGAGKLGLLVSMVLKNLGCHAFTIDKSNERVAFARKLGIDAFITGDPSIPEKAEICIDSTGNPLGASQAMSCLYPGGRLVLKTTVAEEAGISLNQVVINEYTIIGSRCGPFAPAIRMLSAGTIDPGPLVSHVFFPEKFMTAFHVATQPGSMKVLLNFAAGI